MSLVRDYARQARTYDETRAASPSVLGPLREALADAPGRRLVDVGGGTGNYAAALRDEGWDPLVVDRQPEMLARAAAKGLETLEADAQRLPLADAGADAVMLVSMLHHVEDPAAALAEARRILRPGGRLGLMVFTREDITGQWMTGYWPSTRAWMVESHPTLAELLALLPGARRIEVVYRDLVDGSLAALAGHADASPTPAGTARRATSSASGATTPASCAPGSSGCGPTGRVSSFRPIGSKSRHSIGERPRPRTATAAGGDQGMEGRGAAQARTRPASSAHSSAAR